MIALGARRGRATTILGCGLLFAFYTVCTPSVKIAAQTTTGLPWTYLPDSNFTAEDSAWIHGIDVAHDPLDIRRVYKIRHHIELTDTSGRMISAEMPRNPGKSQIMTWLSGRCSKSYTKVGEYLPDSTFRKDSLVRYNCSGFQSRDPSARAGSSFSVSYLPEQYALDEFYPTSFSGMIQGAPAVYLIYQPRHVPDTIAFFLQFIDSVYHPAISPVREAYVTLREPPFPNPCRDVLHYTPPDDWAGASGEVLVFGGGGRLIHRSSTAFGYGAQRLPEGALAGLPAGQYVLTLRNPRESPGVAVAQITVW